MKKRDYFLRYSSIGVVFVLVCLIYLIKLVNVQITGQDYYKAGQSLVYTERRVTLYATRGEIFDRNGVPLITNDYSYTVCFEAGSFPYDKTEGNALIVSTVDRGADAGAVFEMPELPLFLDGERWMYGDLTYGKGKRLANHLADMNLDDPSPTDAAEALMVRFGIGEFDEENDDRFHLTVDEEDAMLLFNIRLDMLLSDFSQSNPYAVLTDAPTDLIINLREGSVRGILVRAEAERVYEIPGLASHILGRVGKIQAEKAEYYTELGYPLDAIVGTSGVEAAFEEYLHGTNGTLVIVEDSMGNTVDTYVETEPIPGKDVYLTIDAKLQAVAEQSLADNIAYIVENALAEGKPLSGEDADAGALTVMSPKTGEVYALASYPTYDLTTFSENYATLSEDPATPMLNRALMGIYTPGSTFKVGVAVAALNEGIISPYTTIHTTGKYTYYEDSGFTPRCWINLMYGGNAAHGTINVTKAIQVSCNCFFYEMGRLLTINTMNEYCRELGLGEPTGIELPESTGILAGPDYRAEAGLGAWSPGDTVQAAIGQIENSFTPLQISVYTSAILNGGTRIGAHILKDVREYGSAEPIYTAQPAVLSAREIDPDVITVVKNAMRNVTEDTGSAARLFENYPLTIGGKTGTAQVSETQSDNAVFTAFAPFNDPELVATCVIEKGAGGTDAGFSVRDVFSHYFDIDYEDGFDLFQKRLHGEDDITDTDDTGINDGDAGDTNDN